jgi:hypothetical protein
MFPSLLIDAINGDWRRLDLPLAAQAYDEHMHLPSALPMRKVILT